MTGVTRKRLLLHKGRSGGDSDPFARLPVEVLQSPACATLPHAAHRVLVALAAQYSGRANGSLSLTRRTAATFGLGNPQTLGTSLAELEARGLIVRTRLGTRIPPRSAFFALGWLRIDEPLRNDPHELTATLMPPDAWTRWIAGARGPHWTVTRRAARYSMCTTVSSACVLRDPLTGSAGVPTNPRCPVAQVCSSKISTRGRR